MAYASDSFNYHPDILPVYFLEQHRVGQLELYIADDSDGDFYRETAAMDA